MRNLCIKDSIFQGTTYQRYIFYGKNDKLQFVIDYDPISKYKIALIEIKEIYVFSLIQIRFLKSVYFGQHRCYFICLWALSTKLISTTSSSAMSSSMTFRFFMILISFLTLGIEISAALSPNSVSFP